MAMRADQQFLSIPNMALLGAHRFGNGDAVIDGIADGARAGRCRRRAESDRIELRLVVRHTRRTGQDKHAGRAVIGARDAVLSGEIQNVAIGEPGPDRHPRARQIAAAVGIARRQRAVERDRRSAGHERRSSRAPAPRGRPRRRRMRHVDRTGRRRRT